MRLHDVTREDRPIGGSVISIGAPAVARDPGVPDDDQLELAIAWVAHELRGPLLGVKAALETLEGSTASDSAALLDRCRAEVDRLSTLVNDTLRWGVAGESPRMTDCDLVEVVRAAIERCRLETGDDRVILHGPPQAPVHGDAVQLESAISNLVRNALKYAPGGTEIDVVIRVADTVSVTVRNGGRPIPFEDQATIFLPFARGANADGRAGKGLGLFIARRIVEANRGRLSVVSHDGATEFRIDLPGGGR